jgi:hypothetical protein
VGNPQSPANIFNGQPQDGSEIQTVHPGLGPKNTGGRSNEQLCHHHFEGASLNLRGAQLLRRRTGAVSSVRAPPPRHHHQEMQPYLPFPLAISQSSCECPQLQVGEPEASGLSRQAAPAPPCSGSCPGLSAAQIFPAQAKTSIHLR